MKKVILRLGRCVSKKSKNFGRLGTKFDFLFCERKVNEIYLIYFDGIQSSLISGKARAMICGLQILNQPNKHVATANILW